MGTHTKLMSKPIEKLDHTIAPYSGKEHPSTVYTPNTKFSFWVPEIRDLLPDVYPIPIYNSIHKLLPLYERSIESQFLLGMIVRAMVQTNLEGMISKISVDKMNSILLHILIEEVDIESFKDIIPYVSDASFEAFLAENKNKSGALTKYLVDNFLRFSDERRAMVNMYLNNQVKMNLQEGLEERHMYDFSLSKRDKNNYNVTLTMRLNFEYRDRDDHFIFLKQIIDEEGFSSKTEQMKKSYEDREQLPDEAIDKWTSTEKREVEKKFMGDINEVWSRGGDRDIFELDGGKGKVYLKLNLIHVHDKKGTNWTIIIHKRKLKNAKALASGEVHLDVSHFFGDVVASHENFSKWSSTDPNWRPKTKGRNKGIAGKSFHQRDYIHEFGHMIGGLKNDEYTNPGNTDYESVMNRGEAINPTIHLKSIVDWLGEVFKNGTGRTDYT